MNRTWSPFRAQALPPTAPLTESIDVNDRHERSQNRVNSSTKRNDKVAGEPVDHIRSTTISFRNMTEYGGLLVKYLEVRKLIFLDQLGWHVSESDGMEFDQYDTPYCRWIVIHQFGEVLGGVRMVPTTAKCGPFSYMIRDAQMGLLEDIPTDILFFEAPVEHSVWEATRFFITDSVPAQQRQRVQSLLFLSMSETAMDNGATHVLGIVPALWARWARRLGVNATPIGAKFSIDGTASQSVLFKVSDFIS
ncbi:acyl-homoserine-lactone synthase [uncultured Roseovarius sp.]|uniref:acyl-homoserine-lactone synthase n=2 Tax=Roseovarius sp. TaxID=1486281 RepID=UPI0025FFE01D|nr:acyl-homoserine-lactone synthase [uncultured Roseovarius sp.]